MRTVRCTTSGCEYAGVSRDVPDVPVSPGVVQRPPLFCASCGNQLPDATPTVKKREKAVRTPPETRGA